MLRWLTSGESHGQALVGILEGVPAGVAVESADIRAALARRRLGYGRGPRMRFEQDQVTILGGVRHGRTLGSPVAIEVGNSEWDKDPDKWQKEMSVSAADGPTEKPLTQVRPGRRSRLPFRACPPRPMPASSACASCARRSAIRAACGECWTRRSTSPVCA